MVAHAHLLGADPALATLVEADGVVDAYTWVGEEVAGDDLLAGLTLHIVGQQISVAAALSIFRRLRMGLGGEITASGLAAIETDALRGVGLSGTKARALVQLGRRIADGHISLGNLAAQPDADVISALVMEQGIGPWTAQTFLLHQFRRPDVLPVGDVGIREAIAQLDGLADRPSKAPALERGTMWGPYRSYAAAHLWRSLRARGRANGPLAMAACHDAATNRLNPARADFGRSARR
ncbi:MAG: DNA-3-methyladenine glycosylase family protein [Acidimicrobiia bacterium]